MTGLPRRMMPTLRAVPKALFARAAAHASCSRVASSDILSRFATVDPWLLSAKNPYTVKNLGGGLWFPAAKTFPVVDPLNGEAFIHASDSRAEELAPLAEALSQTPIGGVHNPLKNPERFLLYGQVCERAAAFLHKKEVFDFFVKCIQRVMPKSYEQAGGEVDAVRKFLENYSGDSIRLMMRGFCQSGDHVGQQSHGYRWPYGAAAVISPFNFPLEIPAMQMLSAAMVGNRPVVKAAAKTTLPVEQFLRLLHHCGLPKEDILFASCSGPEMSKLMLAGHVRVAQFTGGERVAKELLDLLEGRVKIEDSGYGWKLVDRPPSSLSENEILKLASYIAHVSDQDAYAMSGQKCSSQSMLLLHRDWSHFCIWDMLRDLASERTLQDLTCSPILSVKNQEIEKHLSSLLALPGSKLLFGGRPLQGHSVPLDRYGAFEPTAVFVPLDAMADREAFKLITREIFGPVQVVTDWVDEDLPRILGLINSMEHHLTAAVVSDNPRLILDVVGRTAAGTTYAGLRGRTTGAPANHWFGPGGDPRAAGIGTPEAITSTWTGHREIIHDVGAVPPHWSTPKRT